MIAFLSRIPIFQRIFIIFGVAVVIPAIAIILLGNFFLGALNTRSQVVQTSFDAQNAAWTQQVNLQRMNAQLQTLFNNVFANLDGTVQDASLRASGSLIANDITDLEVNFDQALPQYDQRFEIAASPGMDTIRSIIQSDSPGSTIIDQQKQHIDRVLDTDWPEYKQLQDKELAILNQIQADNVQQKVYTAAQVQTSYEDAYNTLYSLNKSYTYLRNDWQGVVDNATEMGKTVTSVGNSATQPVVLVTAIALLLSLFAIIITGAIVSLTITGPLRRLAKLTRRISEGDTSARANSAGRDEIAMVAQSMNSMLDNIVLLIQESNTRREGMQRQVEKLISEVSGVGEGDLGIQAEVTSDALGVLADSFNYMVEELGGLIVRVKAVAREVERSTSTTFDSMTQLVGVADTQIKQMAGAAVEVERMATTSRQVADRARVLESVAREAHEMAYNGRQAMAQTVGGMKRIQTHVTNTSYKVHALGESSQEIRSIIDAIARITHQTNRLALDAAIQAAMAGENGKGFGAVAADIRRLAAQAKNETDAITRIVRGVGEDIAAVATSMQETERETMSGAQLAEEAGHSLYSIFGVVERQEQEIDAINHLADQQMQSSGDVVQVMRTVTTTTEQSSVSTREAAQNMERMARLAEQLLASVEAFKLREDLVYNPDGATAARGQESFDRESISGIFRAITASAQIVPGGTAYPSPVPLAVPASASDRGNRNDQYAAFKNDLSQGNTGSASPRKQGKDAPGTSNPVAPAARSENRTDPSMGGQSRSGKSTDPSIAKQSKGKPRLQKMPWQDMQHASPLPPLPQQVDWSIEEEESSTRSKQPAQKSPPPWSL